MKVAAVIAVRNSGDAKSRCAGTLSRDARSELVCAMLADMIDRLGGSTVIDELLVVTPDEPLARSASDLGITTIREEAAHGINAAFVSARTTLRTSGERTLMLALPGDLPLIDAEALDSALRNWGAGSVLLAPSHDGGTAAIALDADTAFDFRFGPGSFAAHQEETSLRGLTCLVRSPAGSALDLDSPGQFAEVVRAAPLGRTAMLLRALR